MVTSKSAGELNSIQAILNAASFAAEKHATQKRKGAAAEPYINHLLEVAHLVSAALAEPDTDYERRRQRPHTGWRGWVSRGKQVFRQQ